MTQSSIRTVQQSPVVEAWVTMNYFAPFEPMKKTGWALACFRFGRPGNPAVLTPRKVTTNEMARDSSRVDAGVYLRRRIYCSSGTARRIARLRGSDAHSKGPPGELKKCVSFGNESKGTRVCKVRPCLLLAFCSLSREKRHKPTRGAAVLNQLAIHIGSNYDRFR